MTNHLTGIPRARDSALVLFERSSEPVEPGTERKTTRGVVLSLLRLHRFNPGSLTGAAVSGLALIWLLPSTVHVALAGLVSTCLPTELARAQGRRLLNDADPHFLN